MFGIGKKEKLVEVCRSFAYKLNCGNYESRDFFCSQKAEVPEAEAVKTSEALYEFVKSEVIKSVNKYQSVSIPVKPTEKVWPSDARDRIENDGVADRNVSK